MFQILLIVALMTFSSACALASTTPTPKVAEGTNYTELITKFATTRHPNDPFQFKVKMVKLVQTEHGPTEVLALQVHIFYDKGAESYILFVRKGKILSWLYAGEPEVEEEEDEEEVFPAKDQA